MGYLKRFHERIKDASKFLLPTKSGVFVLGATLLFCIILGLKLHLGLTRYFDPDEFTHGHWAWLLSHGYVPYRDFFLTVFPVFNGLFAPLFFLPDGPYLMILLRVFAFAISGGVLILLFIMARRHRFSLSAILCSLIVFTVFPITVDKSIEFRPDMLMIFFFLWSSILFLSPTRVKKTLFFAGLFYGFSVLILFKSLVLSPALAFLFFAGKKRSISYFMPTLIGFAFPFLCIGIVFLFLGIVPLSVESLRQSVLLHTATGAFSPFLALSPWPLVYTNAGGMSIPWAMQIALWILGSVGVILGTIQSIKTKQLLFPFLSIYTLCSIISLFLFPRPHLQYFIPISIPIAIGVGYCVGWMFVKLRKKTSIVFNGMFYGFLVVATVSFTIQYKEKSISTNTEQLRVLADIAVLPKNEPIYDMVGSYLYRPDGYYICCNWYADFYKKLPWSVPSLAEALTASQTKYILMDQKGYVFWIATPTDLQFLLTHYLPSKQKKLYTPGVRFFCAKGLCTQQGATNLPAFPTPTHEFSLHITGTYKLTTIPSGQSVSINGNMFYDNETHHINQGTYTFFPTSSLSSFTLQYEENK